MPTIKYKGRSLEVVFEFQYLGVCFNYNNKCNIAQKSLYDKTSRAMFGLLKKCRKLMLPLDIQTELFDSPHFLVRLWGMVSYDLASKLQLRFYKIILKLSISTPGYYYQSYYCYWSLLYSAILRSWADSLRSHVILHEWIAFYSAFLFLFFISTEVVYLQRWHGWCHKKPLPSRRVLCTPYNHAPCHFMQSHIRKVYACLVVTCHLPVSCLVYGELEAQQFLTVSAWGPGKV